MKKKIVLFLMTGMILSSVIGCGEKEKTSASAPEINVNELGDLFESHLEFQEESLAEDNMIITEKDPEFISKVDAYFSTDYYLNYAGYKIDKYTTLQDLIDMGFVYMDSKDLDSIIIEPDDGVYFLHFRLGGKDSDCELGCCFYNVTDEPQSIFNCSINDFRIEYLTSYEEIATKVDFNNLGEIKDFTIPYLRSQLDEDAYCGPEAEGIWQLSLETLMVTCDENGNVKTLDVSFLFNL